jgi:hypothetical protein
MEGVAMAVSRREGLVGRLFQGQFIHLLDSIRIAALSYRHPFGLAFQGNGEFVWIVELSDGGETR